MPFLSIHLFFEHVLYIDLLLALWSFSCCSIPTKTLMYNHIDQLMSQGMYAAWIIIIITTFNQSISVAKWD